MSPLKSSLLIAILTFVSACGRQVVEFRNAHDSGPTSDVPLIDAAAIDADTPIGDRPVVTSTVPVNGANGVALTTAITATFSKPMTPATVTTMTFTVRQGATPVNGTPYDVSFNQYIYPSAPFSAGEDVIVRVDPDDANSVMLWGKG